MLKANLSEPITKSVDYAAFDVASVTDDYENSRVVAVVQCGETRLPLILWDGPNYDPARNWTNATVIARVKEVLPAALA